MSYSPFPLINGLINDTQDIIEYVKNTKSKNKRKYSFWELIDKND